MKKTYFFVLTVITTAFVLGLAALKINEACNNTLFSIPTEYQKYVDFARDYGAMTLLCLFAFGGLAGKAIKIVFGILIILAIVIFIVAAAAPQFFHNIFNGSPEAIVRLVLKA